MGVIMTLVKSVKSVSPNMVVTYNVEPPEYDKGSAFYYIGYISKIESFNIDNMNSEIYVQWLFERYMYCYDGTFANKMQKRDFSVYQTNITIDRLMQYYKLFTLDKLQ